MSDSPMMPCEPGEQWRAIPDTEDLYYASNQGRIWSRPRKGTKGGVLKGSTDPDGYRQVLLTMNGKPVGNKIHRLVALAFIGPRPEGQEVRHLDGNKLNNHLSNLAYGTHRLNTQERVLHGHHYQANKTHCPKGHEYAGDNVRIRSDGARTCVACERERQGWQGGIAAALRTHCPQGHPYEGDNLLITENGWRKCRTCS